MRAEEVLSLVDAFRGAGIELWIDGGWGVDALVGRQTRPHDDLDLVVGLADVTKIRAPLEPEGYTVAEDHLPVRFVMTHPERGQLDFHTVRFDAEGGGNQPQPGGGSFRYPPEGFTTGSIAGREVRCISFEVQLLCHQGYEPTDKDRHDVELLCQSFDRPLPKAYRRGLSD